ncbi:MAG: methylated-DNA--[protein]-cysteine S-methyltransferase [Ilumatobacteraceae bacterium]|nr:methylated-DNA--[protein]-cysteine S-methyltransferase [Ilumatobacteraceae bacterium]
MNTKQTGQNKLVRNDLVVASPVGKLRLVASEKGLVAIDIGNNTKQAVTTTNSSAQAILMKTKKQLEQYFAGKRSAFDIDLDLVGTDFQVQAWRALCRIPYGTTISYGRQAASIKKPKAFRAVGSANGKNPIPIVVPCHRVVASDGTLGGYSLGLRMKKQLLKLEGVSEAE